MNTFLNPRFFLPLLIILAATAILTSPASSATTTGEPLKLALFDWITYLNESAPAAGLAVNASNIEILAAKAISVNIFIAVQHFNERRADIVPALAQVPHSCKLNLSIVSFCDTQNDPIRATVGFAKTMSLNSPHAMIGGSGPETARDLILMSSNIAEIPFVSHRAHDALFANRDPYTLFARTWQDDGDYSNTLANLISFLNYSEVVVLFVQYADSESMAYKLRKNLLQAYNIQPHLFSFTDLDPISTLSAFENAAKLQLNVIVCIASTISVLTQFPNFATQTGLIDGKLWIFTDYDRPFTQVDIDTSANLSSLLQNSYRLDTTIQLPDPVFSSYLERWAQDEFVSVIPSINARLPPQGFANDSKSCANDMNNLQLPSTFFADTVALQQDAWALAYDTVIAIGLGACAALNPYDGPTLYQSVIQQDFKACLGVSNLTR